MGHAFTSLGVMLGGLVGYLRNWNYADAIVSTLLALWIGRAAFAVVKSALNILMEVTPEGLELPPVSPRP